MTMLLETSRAKALVIGILCYTLHIMQQLRTWAVLLSAWAGSPVRVFLLCTAVLSAPPRVLRSDLLSDTP